jgi:ribosome assembly protein RRB1
MKFERVKINGNINRIKSMKNSYLTAYWTDKGTVEIVDTRSLINEIESSNKEENDDLLKQTNKKKKLVLKNITVNSFKRKLEGFGLDWSPFDDYALAAGGHDKILEIYSPKDEMCSEYSVKFSINKAHLDSIEDIAFSPFDKGILATCSIDRSIKLWDQRMNTVAMNIQNAHKSDVNVIAFNPHSYQVDKTTGKAKNVLLASGGDDGCIKVWDTRRLSSTDYIDNIEWHKGPITSLSWDPYDDTQLAVASEDNSLSIWDFAVEPDDNQLFDYSNKQIPQQLVFLHQGQQNIKDLKFHPLFKNLLVTTAENGINVFKPNFEDDGDYEEEMENEENEEMDIDD